MYETVNETGKQELLRLADMLLLPMAEDTLAKFFQELHEGRTRKGLDVTFIEKEMRNLANSNSVLAEVFVANLLLMN